MLGSMLGFGITVPSDFVISCTRSISPIRHRRYHVGAFTLSMSSSTPSQVSYESSSSLVRIPDDMVSVAHAAVDASGEVIRGYFRAGSLTTQLKADESPVTAADVGAETAIRRVLEEAYPEHAVLGEESGGSREALLNAEWAWVLDPLDGTKAFVSGRATFGTLVAVLHRGIPVYGVIDQPILGERWTGGTGRPTSFNDNLIHVRRPAPTLSQCLVHATSPEMFLGDDAARFQAVRRATRGAVYGEDCYAYAMLSSGFVDLVVEADLKPWDFCALIPVVEAAGGVIRDWDGFAVGPESDGRVIAACSEELLMETLETMKEAVK